MSERRAYPLGVVLGALGLSQLVHVGVGLSGKMSSAHTLEKLKLFKSCELVFEALPQSLLQVRGKETALFDTRRLKMIILRRQAPDKHRNS